MIQAPSAKIAASEIKKLEDKVRRFAKPVSVKAMMDGGVIVTIALGSMHAVAKRRRQSRVERLTDDILKKSGDLVSAEADIVDERRSCILNVGSGGPFAYFGRKRLRQGPKRHRL